MRALSQRLHRPVLVLAETVENKIQKLVLGDTSRLENLALLGLGCLRSVFLRAKVSISMQESIAP